MYLVPILFVLPDVDTLLSVASGQPMPLLYKIVTGSPGGGFGLLILIIGIGFFAGIGALTAACKPRSSYSENNDLTIGAETARCTWAFSRDGAIPFSGVWSRVNSHYGLPVWALALSTIVDCLLGFLYLGSSAGQST